MRKIYRNKGIYFALAFLLFVLSCTESNTGFLDPDLSGELNKDMVFSDSTYTYEFQAKIYRDLQVTYFADNGMSGGGLWSWSDLTDDSKNKWSGSAQMAHMFNVNSVNDPNFARFRNHWTNGYSNIYRANTFLQYVDDGPLSARKKELLKAETRLMRAWYYFSLLRLYGGVPLLGDRVYGILDKVEEPRATFASVVDYIVSECDELAKILPVEQNGQDYGRLTSGAALAIKARVLLFAASPLSNGKIPTTDPDLIPLLGNATEDKELWKKAADAAKAVIDLGRYSLYEDNTTAPGYGFYLMQNTRVNKEYIFSCMKRNYRFYETMLLPGSRGGQVYASPFQGLVDAFWTKEGKAITDPTSNYDENSPYINRDPRFEYTILYDGSMWIPRSGSSIKERVSFYKGAPSDGFTTGGATKTGYAFRKFCNENVSGASNNNDNVSPFIRLAEMYLNYAEALNEYDPSGSKAAIENALITIRRRAGIEPGADNRYGLPATYTQAEMREIIHTERRLEFALEEGHRFFDLKRWAELEIKKSGVDFYGILWTDPKDGPQTYELYFIEKHQFDPGRQYYFPIPLSEVNILGSELLKQNPGW